MSSDSVLVYRIGGVGFVIAGTSIAARRTKAARASTRPVETSA